MFPAILQALKTGIDICRFHKTAADMPHAGKNHKAVLAFFAVALLLITMQLQSLFLQMLKTIAAADPQFGKLMGEIAHLTPQQLMLSALLQLTSLGLLYYGLLMMRNKTARFGQSALAFLVINTLFGLLFLLLFPPLLATADQPNGLGSIIGMALFIVAIINFVIIIRIIRNTIEVPWGVAFLAFLALYYGASLFSSILIFGTLGAPATI